MQTLVLSKNLRKAIRNKGMTVREVATKADVGYKNLYSWMAGVVPNVVAVYKVAKALDTTVEALAFGDSRARQENEYQGFELVLFGINEQSIKERIYKFTQAESKRKKNEK